jgi:putative FmdB family regulatory protein
MVMPIYEYQCKACGHALEAMQKMSDDALTDCPICQKATLEKLISATSFQLKGTGWYVTDFRNKNPSDANTGTSTVSSPSPVETKPVPKTPTDSTGN